MSTIVYAAIAITVLLVILLIFTSNIKKPANEFTDKSNVDEDKVEDILGEEYMEESEFNKVIIPLGLNLEFL